MLEVERKSSDLDTLSTDLDSKHNSSYDEQDDLFKTEKERSEDLEYRDPLTSTILKAWFKLAIPAVCSNVAGFLILLINSAIAG